MSTFTLTLIVLACVAVVGVLILGVFSMAKGGEFNQKYGNKLMQLRILFQGLALALLAMAYFSSQK
ncbi:MAG: twin transmembrane helix small protein [Alphaproteobacteria bacterium]|nr:twin transmembrane helix small protein [Alphaproteobacteria bacterium]MCD8563213.1 twin transmembrane helix small protein [Alphaproteobacteria bacterium]